MSALNTPFDLSTRFARRRLHLGVCGSVSAYKAPDLLRAWLGLGIHVSVVLTAGARQFVTPLLFESLGALPVYTEMFVPGAEVFGHLEPGQQADVFVLAPASADALCRLAHGAASDMLAAQALAFAGPLVIAPAMNPRMWAHPATQANAALLRERGASIVEPHCGGTACGDEGRGRLAPLSEIFFAALRALSPQDMAGKKVLLTLGPTREVWDSVRFWSNPSSGNMGAALAVSAYLRGAEVTAVCGPGVTASLPAGIVRRDVLTAEEMFAAAQEVWPTADMGMFCAAVADFSPVPPGAGKFKKADAPNGFSVRFTPNADILATLAGAKRPQQKVLGFAAEDVPDAAALAAAARAKLARKKADLLAANCITQAGCGFGTATNSLLVVDSTGREELRPLESKADAAWELCSWLLRL